jgi:hypothetical protein
VTELFNTQEPVISRHMGIPGWARKFLSPGQRRNIGFQETARILGNKREDYVQLGDVRNVACAEGRSCASFNQVLGQKHHDAFSIDT